HALAIEQDTLGQAMEWAVAPGQTPERLRAGLAALRDLPKMPPAAEVVQAEALLTEKTLDLPTDELKRPLEDDKRNRPYGPSTFWNSIWLDAVLPPWERVRARRVNRLSSIAMARVAMLEPWQRPASTTAGNDGGGPL